MDNICAGEMPMTRSRGEHNAVPGTVDGRLVVLAGVACYFLAFWLCISSWNVNLMQAEGVLIMSPGFSDMRGLISGVESSRAGLDPLVMNPADPWHRPMNYPRIWLLLEKTGLSQAHLRPLGFAVVSAFYLAATGLVVQKKSDRKAVAVWLAALLSPAVLLGVERANIDLVMFVLLAVAIAGLGLEPMAKRVPFYVIMFLAAALKLFPALAMVTFLRERMKVCLMLMTVFGLAFLVYIAATFGDVTTMLRYTEHFTHISYGNMVLFDHIDKNVCQKELHFALGSSFVKIAGWVTTMIALAAGFFAFRRKVGAPAYSNGRYLSLFRAGAGIYVGTYLQGYNFDYRLIFLLFMLPQLMEWGGQQATGGLSRFTLVLVLVALWSEFAVRMVRLSLGMVPTMEEMCNWVLFTILAFLLAATLPEWAKPRRYGQSSCTI
jgi:hypothetical protein